MLLALINNITNPNKDCEKRDILQYGKKIVFLNFIPAKTGPLFFRRLSQLQLHRQQIISLYRDIFTCYMHQSATVSVHFSRHLHNIN